MRRRYQRAWVLVVAIVVVALQACAAPAPRQMPTPEPTATQTPQPEPTATAQLEASPTETAPPTQTPLPDTPEPTSIPITDTPAPAQDRATAWAADGTISDGEYTSQADFGDMRLWWRNDAEHLYIAMEGDTSGWVAIGINPERGMQGANYILGFVANGEASIWDAYGTAPAGANHPPDEDLGGTDDIVAAAGVEDGSVTRFEVKIPMNSGDDYDQALTPGETYPLIIAIGDADDFNAYHRRYDRGELALAPAP